MQLDNTPGAGRSGVLRIFRLRYYSGIVKYAGVHLYSEEGDVLYANKQLLAVHTIRGGERTLRLPEKAEVVYDLFVKEIVAENTDTLRVELPKRSTSLYYVGDPAVLESLR